MTNFIYVFTTQDKDTLESIGLKYMGIRTMAKSKEFCYVFEYSVETAIPENMEYVFSNTLVL